MAEKITHRLALMRAFQQYVEGREDKSIIEKYTVREIKYALEKCAFGDHCEMWYYAMQNRLEELQPGKSEEAENIRIREKRWNSIILAIMVTIVGMIGIFWVYFVLKFGL